MKDDPCIGQSVLPSINGADDYHKMQMMSNNNCFNRGKKLEFDICWFDLQATPDVLRELKPYQRISQWPGIGVVAHKNKLGANLMYLRSIFEDDYDFFPLTYMLPFDMLTFKRQFVKKKPPEIEPEKLESKLDINIAESQIQIIENKEPETPTAATTENQSVRASASVTESSKA